MKAAIVTICVTLCILGVAVLGDVAIRYRSAELTRHCEVLIDIAATDDIQAAREQFALLEAYWEQAQAEWMFYVCHGNLLDIQQALVRVRFALEEGDAQYLRLSAALLENEIQDVPNMEVLRLTSVF